MRKLYEIFKVLKILKRISAETICGNTVHSFIASNSSYWSNQFLRNLINMNSLNIPTLNSFDIYCLRNTFLSTQSSSSRPAQNIVLHSFMHAFYIFFGSKNQLHSTLNNFFDCSRQLVKSFCLNYSFFCSVHQMQYLCRAVGRSEKWGGGASFNVKIICPSLLR